MLSSKGFHFCAIVLYWQYGQGIYFLTKQQKVTEIVYIMAATLPQQIGTQKC